MKNELTFTQRDFLNACDLINRINQDSSEKFGIWIDAADGKYSFVEEFTNKKKAKQVLYNFVGLNINGYSIHSYAEPGGWEIVQHLEKPKPIPAVFDSIDYRATKLMRFIREEDRIPTLTEKMELFWS
jgi:hypothetical protein